MYEDLIKALRLAADKQRFGNYPTITVNVGTAYELATALESLTAQLAALQAENGAKDKEIAKLKDVNISQRRGLRQLRDELSGVEAERDAASNTKLELFFGRGELGVDTVAENEDSPLREILIRRLQSPVIPIGSTLGDKGKTVDELENILVRMHFENVESALVLERALQIVLGSFVEPRRGAQGEG